jgi:hypothetical protein
VFAAGAPLSRPLNLSDRVVDLVNEGYDCAVRVGDLPDSSLVSVRLADNRRLCVAAPAYLLRAGTPAHPSELAKHQCLTLSSEASQSRGWAFSVDGQVTHLRPGGRLDCSDGQVLHEWCREGLGIAWRSTWKCRPTSPPAGWSACSDEFAAPPNGIHAVSPAPATCRCGCACGSISSSTATATVVWTHSLSPAGLRPDPAVSGFIRIIRESQTRCERRCLLPGQRSLQLSPSMSRNRTTTHRGWTRRSDTVSAHRHARKV